MTINKAIIDTNGLCHNTTVVPDNWQPGDARFWQPPPGYTVVDQGERGQIGAVYDPQTRAFVDPEEPEPPAKTDLEREVAALKKGFQALVDEKVIGKDKLPPDLDVTAVAIERVP